LLASRALVVDACRRVVRDARTVVSLARRPVLFALVRALGEAWPADVPRDMLSRGHSARQRAMNRIARGCGSSRAASRDARTLAASPRRSAGLRWRRAAPARSPCWRRRSKASIAAVLAFLADGESWSSSALALALGASQRSVQRALDSLAAAGKVRRSGAGEPAAG
jgi:hypothetical protein